LTATIERGRDDAAVYYWRGTTRHMQDDYAGAETDFIAAIARDPDHVDAHSRMGLVLRQIGRWQEACSAYQHAVALAPSRGEDWAGLAACARRVGDEETWKAAIEQARRLLDTGDLYSAACLASVGGEIDRALALLRQALKEHPDLANWAAKDPDLHWIRDDSRFRQIVDSATGAE
jgi:tetratricopeptide (TPR) repeat protein